VLNKTTGFHIQQPGLFRELIMVQLLLPPFLQWRLTNCGKGPHTFCEHSVASS